MKIVLPINGINKKKKTRLYLNFNPSDRKRNNVNKLNNHRIRKKLRTRKRAMRNNLLQELEKRG